MTRIPMGPHWPGHSPPRETNESSPGVSPVPSECGLGPKGDRRPNPMVGFHALQGVEEVKTDMRAGNHPAVKDGGLSNNSVRNYQAAVRRFYRYHTDLEVDAEDIVLVTGDDTHVDDRDMLTKDEIEAIRDAAEHPRDLAIFDLLLYTGQRNTAIRSLRIKNIDLDEGVYYVNYPDLPRSGLPGPRLLRSGLPVSASELVSDVDTAVPDSAGDVPSREGRSAPLRPVGHSATPGGARFLSRLNTAGDMVSIVLPFDRMGSNRSEQSGRNQ